MRISDWSSDVCSSDLEHCADRRALALLQGSERFRLTARLLHVPGKLFDKADMLILRPCPQLNEMALQPINRITERSEEHTSELQSLMSISYAVFCLKKKKNDQYTTITTQK